MKIIKIEITAFGALKKFVLEPKDNLLSICEHNGYGKSTICGFICAMLYGIPKKTLKNNLRKRAIPYDANVAGGTLELEFNNHLYRIVGKFFSKQKDDSLLFYEGTKLIDAIPGEYLFNLDYESFMKTLFINSYDLEIKSTSNITSRLGHYSIDQSEELSFDNAMKYLEELKKSYKPLRSNDIKGSIAISKNKIDHYKDEISNLKSKEMVLNKSREEYNQLMLESLRLDKEYRLSTETEKNNTYFSCYKEKKENLENKKNELETLLKNYQAGIMPMVAIDELSNLVKINSLLKNNQRNAQLSLDDEKRLEYLKMKFKDLPSNDEISSKRGDVINLKALMNSSFCLKDEESSLLNKYQYINKDELLSKIDKLNEEYEQTKNMSTKPIKNNHINLIMLIVSVVVLFVGLGAGFINKYLFSIPLLGLVFVLIFAFLYLNNKVNYQNKVKENLSCGVRVKQDIILNIDKILIPFGFSSELNGNKDIAITLFKEELKKYDDVLNNKAILDEKNIINKENIALIKARLDNFLKKYGYDTSDYSTSLDYMVKDIFNYNNLLNKQKENEDKQAKYKKDLDSNEAKINAIKLRYQIMTDNLEDYLNKVRVDLNTFVNLEQEISLLTKDVDDYYVKYDLASKKINDNFRSSEEVHEKYNDVLSKISSLANYISNLENDLEALDEYKQNLENENLKLEKLNQNYEIITMTIDFLKEASLNIKNKYIKPVKDSFLYYANMLNTLGINVMIDEDYNISFSDGMTIKEYNELSSGEMTSIMLCYRLSVMDNIFKEKPFIILDDVFQSLDSDNFLLVKKMLIKLSEHQQIIYFTCHESRMI